MRYEDNRWWFPTWDHPTDRFTVDTHITVPDGLVARGLGPLVGSQPAEPGWTRWDFALQEEVVAYLVTVVAGAYQVVEIPGGPVPIEVLAGPGVDPARIRRVMEPVPAQIAWYAELLDEPFPYPLARFAFVQRYMYGGMENPSLTLIRDGYLPERDDPLHLDRPEDVLAHEVVHHWFGDSLTCYGWNEWWLNEGFARFYEKRWAGHAHGEDVWARANRDGYRWARGADRALAPDAANRRDPVVSWGGSYPKGAHALRALEVFLGEDVFDAGIRAYVERNRGRLVETADLRRALEDVSGEPLSWFFDQWVRGRGVPHWDVTSSWADGRLTLTFVPDQDQAIFHTPLEVELGTSTGGRTERVWLDGDTTHLVLPLPERPRYIALDPRWGVLGSFTHDQAEAAWIAQLDAVAAPARQEALSALGGLDSSEAVVEALLGRLASEPAPRARVAILEALAGHGSHPRVEEALLELATSAVTSLEAYEAVSALPSSARCLDTLERLSLQAEDPWVRGGAFERLDRLEPGRAVPVARRILRRADPGREGWLHARALQTLAREGDLQILARFAGDPRSRVRRRASQTLGEHLREGGQPGQERLQAQLAAAVLPRLDDPEWASREAALRAAIGLRVIDLPALEQFLARNPDPALDELAREAMVAIRNPGPTGSTLEERLQALEGRLDASGERLDELESGTASTR